MQAENDLPERYTLKYNNRSVAVGKRRKLVIMVSVQLNGVALRHAPKPPATIGLPVEFPYREEAKAIEFAIWHADQEVSK